MAYNTRNSKQPWGKIAIDLYPVVPGPAVIRTVTTGFRSAAILLQLNLNTETNGIILATGQFDIHCKIEANLLIRDLKPALNRPLQKRERTGKEYGCFSVCLKN